MKLKITEKGVNDSKGKPVKVGTVLTVKGDTVPGYLLNKCMVLGNESTGKTPVTNDDPDAPDGDEDLTIDEVNDMNSKELNALIKSEELDIDKKQPVDDKRAAIIEALFD